MEGSTYYSCTNYVGTAGSPMSYPYSHSAHNSYPRDNSTIRYPDTANSADSMPLHQPCCKADRCCLGRDCRWGSLDVNQLSVRILIRCIV
jgi:hypothetical protein